MRRPPHPFVALALLVAAGIGVAAGQAPSFPAPLGDYLRNGAQLTAAELAALRGDTPVTKMLDSDPAREVAVFGAVWIEATPADYLAAVKDIETFERGAGFLVTKKISDPPVIADFQAMQFSDEDIDELKSCTVGDCAIKLGEEPLQRFKSQIDWTKPTARRDATMLARQLALDYVKGYLSGGNAELAVFRDSKNPTFVAEEFKSLIGRMPKLTTYLPGLQKYLLDYPKATLPNSSSFLYWQAVEFGLKPTVRINHVVMQELPGGAVVASKQIYASHYFWTALELRVLIEDPSRGKGFYLVTVTRSRSDGLTGFVGRLVRSRVRNGARDGVQKALESTKALLENPGLWRR